MVNLKHTDFQYEFSVNGGDTKTSKWALIFPFVFFVMLAAGYYKAAPVFINPDFVVYGWIGVIGVSVMATGLLYSSLSKGGFSRFIVKIDLPNAEISAYDRMLGQTLWVEEFFPSQLYISKIELSINGEDYQYPALVYSDEMLESVEESVPYPERSVLGYGEDVELKKVLEGIDHDINQLY